MATQERFKALQERVQSSVVNTVKSTNRLAAEDLPFQRTANPSVAEDLDEKTERVLELSSNLLKSAAAVCGQAKVPSLEDTDDVDMHWRKIIDIVDSVLETADRTMDEFTGALKRKDAPVAETTPQPKKQKTQFLTPNMRNANITKPQLAFERPFDNQSPWKPVLSRKPNSNTPLKDSLVSTLSGFGLPEHKHPYESEITQAEMPDHVFRHAEPIPYHPFESTKATWVDTYEGVLEMLKELKKAKEIAIDLEHHDYRTYAGLLSLMQISTRDQDWIVDTLKPWRHRLEILNEVFTDPKIVKVFHGAHMDMQWLQRDLGLYVNGLFDTYFAAKALGYPQRSLAFLLSKFVDFEADKKYQMADWRIRPLPDEMFYYARSDTHYLLYVYDMIRNELVKASDRSRPETDLIGDVVRESKELSLSRYEGLGFNTETGRGARGWYNLLLKQPMPLSGPQFAVYRAIWKWRDEVARAQDESTGYVLPNATVADIARHMPPDAKALHSLIPNHSVIAKRHLNDIWAAFQEARARGANEPGLFDFFQNDPHAPATRRAAPATTSRVTDLPDDVESGKLVKSQLFGDVPISSHWEEKPSVEWEGKFVLLPWQRLLQDAGAGAIFKSVDAGVGAESAEAKKSGAPGETKLSSGMQKDDLRDEEFTLKAGGKQQAPAQDSDSSSSSESEDDDDNDDDDAGAALKDTSDEVQEEDGSSEVEAESEIEIEDEEERQKREKQERKAAKAQRKAAKKSGKSGSENGTTPEKHGKKAARRSGSEVEFAEVNKAEKKRRKQEKKERQAAKAAKKKAKAEAEAAKQTEEPFDYSKASTVLRASRAGQAGIKEKFDPYAKSGDDVIKGARKAPPLHGGKSATFKK